VSYEKTAIDDAARYHHLSEEELEEFGRECDAIRKDITESLGPKDAEYIQRVIKLQRRLVVAARITLFASPFPPAWVAGTAMLAAAKIIENMELGHNIMHGQWDWMNDPEIHSGTWEWDTTCPAEGWKHSHNYVHHTWTNVLGKDNDVGYGILRVTPDQPWKPRHLLNPINNALLATFFEWGVALHDLDIEAIRKGRKDPDELRRQLKVVAWKVRKQVGKDYIVFPLLSGPGFLSTLTANFTANIIRNLWSYMIIFCGHFPDGAETFTEEQLENEDAAGWYLRQLLSAANFKGSPFLHLMSGNLGYQIEHHMFPDLPSNRYAEMSERVQKLAKRFKLPYTTGPLRRQYGQTLRTILRLTFPTPKHAPVTYLSERESKRATAEQLRALRNPVAPAAAAS
jgi:fatty acid desaturase